MVKATSYALVIPFVGTYLTVVAVNVVGALLFFFLDIPKPPAPAVDTPPSRTRLELL